MRKALLIIGAGVIVAITGVALIQPAAAVILLGLAIAAVGLLLTDFKGPQA